MGGLNPPRSPARPFAETPPWRCGCKQSDPLDSALCGHRPAHARRSWRKLTFSRSFGPCWLPVHLSIVAKPQISLAAVRAARKFTATSQRTSWYSSQLFFHYCKQILSVQGQSFGIVASRQEESNLPAARCKSHHKSKICHRDGPPITEWLGVLDSFCPTAPCWSPASSMTSRTKLSRRRGPLPCSAGAGMVLTSQTELLSAVQTHPVKRAPFH